MKKFLLSLMAVAGAFTMTAQVPSMTPPPGTTIRNYQLHAQDGDFYPGGLASVCLKLGSGVVNRECTGVAVLSYEGKQVAALPASNERRVYCESGFDKHIEKGDIRLDFFIGSAANSPYKKPGNYSMTVPSNFYTVNGVANTPYTVNWTVVGSDASLEVIPSIANQSKVEQLSEVKLTFVGARSISVASESLIFFTDPSVVGTGVEGSTVNAEVHPTIKIDGNVMTLTLEKPITALGYSNLMIDTEIDAVMEDGSKNKYKGGMFTYQIVGKQQETTGDFTVVPAPGTYDFIPAQLAYNEAPIAEGYPERPVYSWFEVELPEGYTASGINAMINMQLLVSIQDAEGKDLYTRGQLLPKFVAGENKFYIVGNVNVDKGIDMAYRTGANLKLASGSYYLTIKAGTLKYKNAEGTVLSCPDMKFGPFTFNAAAPEYTLTPADGSELSSIENIKISFAEGTKIQLDPSNPYATLHNGVILYDFKAETEGSDVIVNLPSALNIPGEYVLDFTQGAIKADDFPMEITAKYTVVREVITDVTLSVNGSVVEGKFVEDDNEYGPHWEASANFAKDDAMKIKFDLPYGFTSLYYIDNNANIDTDEPLTIAFIPSTDLVAGGFQLAENNEIPVKIGVNSFAFTYGDADGNCVEPTLLIFTANEKTTVGVDGIEAVEAEAEYYTLQGVKVVNPENGVYIKVVNGEATKVVVK